MYQPKKPPIDENPNKPREYHDKPIDKVYDLSESSTENTFGQLEVWAENTTGLFLE